MLNIQYIKVPFFSVFSIDDYAEALALGISISGDYAEAPWAFDSFTGYLTGFNRFFSGSGYWLASGSSLELSNYLLDTFSGYNSGVYESSSLNKSQLFDGFDNQFGLFTGNAYNMPTYLLDSYSGYATGSYINSSLNQSFLFQGYDIGSGLFTGSLYAFQDYLNDNYNLYSTGTYSVLTGTVSQQGYNLNSGTSTGNLYSFVENITGGNQGGGSSTGHYWRIVYDVNISTGCGYTGNGYYCSSGIFADYQPYTISSTGDVDGPFGFNDFTVEFWMKRNGWNSNAITVILETSPLYGFSIRRNTSANTLIAYVNNSTIISSGIIPDSSWCHVALTRQVSGLSLYLSGTLNSNLTVSPNTGKLRSNEILAIGTESVYGGSSSSSYPYIGCIDELRIWNYARNQSEIMTNMNNQIVFGSGLACYLTFDP